MDKYIGKRLDGRYEIHELIGKGGMAFVYRAYDIVDDITVAVKILKDEYLGNQEFIHRFKNESKAIAVLCHPNIVKVYDVSFGDRIQYIVMEYIEGITLKEYINAQKEINWQEAVHFTRQILMALQHAHEKGIIHRDVKPQNIMLLRDGTIKVTDFGIARFSKHETRTMTDKAIGSVHYIAPEQARGDITDERADIYSVGVMLYEMLTGELPFEADNAVSVAIMQLQTQPRLPREINISIPAGLEEITLKAMQKKAGARFVSAEMMINDIDLFSKDPDIRFNYRYSSEADQEVPQPTRVAKENRADFDYGDDYSIAKNERDKTRTIKIISGIAAAVVLFALVFGIAVFSKSCSSGGAKDVDVPNFVGMKLSDVEGNPEYKFLWNVQSVYDPNQAEGIIVDQEPKSSTKKVKEGTTITLKVNSSGALVTIPTLKGLTEGAAKAKLSDLGLVCEVLTVNDDETAEGIVKSSDPQSGSKVKAKSTVKIFVSKGSAEKKVNVPDVLGKSLSAAKNELAAKGLKVSDEVIYEPSDKAKDTVLATDPLPGVEVNQGQEVKITVSSGEKREKTIEVYIDLPTYVRQQVILDVYIDGELNTEKNIVPAYTGTYTVYVKGNSGTKTVTVELDGSLYRVFSVNFDSDDEPVKTISKYNFVPANASSEPSSSAPQPSSSQPSSSAPAEPSSAPGGESSVSSAR